MKGKLYETPNCKYFRHDRLLEVINEKYKGNHQGLANDLGIHWVTLSRYLHQYPPTAKHLYEISRFFNVSLDYLFGISDCKEPNNCDSCVHKRNSLIAKNLLKEIQENVHDI